MREKRGEMEMNKWKLKKGGGEKTRIEGKRKEKDKRSRKRIFSKVVPLLKN
jgi:hypothetical protein